MGEAGERPANPVSRSAVVRLRTTGLPSRGGDRPGSRRGPGPVPARRPGGARARRGPRRGPGLVGALRPRRRDPPRSSATTTAARWSPPRDAVLGAFAAEHPDAGRSLGLVADDGTLRLRHDTATAPAELLDAAWWVPGHRHDEPTTGTTAAALVRHTRRPAAVEGPEHLHPALRALREAAAPVTGGAHRAAVVVVTHASERGGTALALARLLADHVAEHDERAPAPSRARGPRRGGGAAGRRRAVGAGRGGRRPLGRPRRAGARPARPAVPARPADRERPARRDRRRPARRPALGPLRRGPHPRGPRRRRRGARRGPGRDPRRGARRGRADDERGARGPPSPGLARGADRPPRLRGRPAPRPVGGGLGGGAAAGQPGAVQPLRPRPPRRDRDPRAPSPPAARGGDRRRQAHARPRTLRPPVPARDLDDRRLRHPRRAPRGPTATRWSATRAARSTWSCSTRSTRSPRAAPAGSTRRCAR